MKPSLFLPVLLLAALPATLDAAPGTVNLPIVQKYPGSQDFAKFGNACAPLGDLNGDGNPDLAIGVEGLFRSVSISFLGADQSLISALTIRENEGGLPIGSAPAGSRFGAALANLGDLDGDGLPELAVGAPGEDAVYILFLQSDGTVRQHVRLADGVGGLPGATFGSGNESGSSCAAVGDLDGNGVTELVVGVPLADVGTLGTDSGALIVVFLNSNGTATGDVETIANGFGGASDGLFGAGDNFGSSCALVGDINFDGLPEIAVGSSSSDIGGTNKGLLFTFSLTAAGTALSFREFSDTGGVPLGNGDRFGSSVVSLGDIDGNGVPDLAVGATNDGAGNFGAVHILFLAPDGALASSFKIADGTSGGLPFGTLGVTDEFFGSSLALLGRSETTGLPLLAVGTPGDSTGGDDRGAVYLLELGDDPLEVTTLTDEFDTPSGPNLSLREAIRDADATNEFRTVRFDPALSGGTFELNIGIGSLAPTTQSLRITGEDVPGGLTLSATDLDRLFILNNATLTVDSLNLVEGNNSGGGGAFLVGAGSHLVLDRVTIASCVGDGGGGAIQSEGSVVITNSTFLDNTANLGGAVFMLGATADLKVSNTTFARNSATGGSDGGGAILNTLDAATTIRYCTFVGNSTGGTGGAILNDFGTVVVGESLFSGNTAANSEDFDNATTNAGGNALAVPASQLMTFGDYGGPTPVQPLKPTSAAKNTAFHRPLPATDQRGAGFPRTVGTGRDPGAVEGTELSDFQPDNRIGLTAAGQIGNNVYNTSGQGQTVKLTLSGRKKTTSFFTVENDGIIQDTIGLRSVAPKKKTLKGKVFRLTGGRTNVSAQVFATGLALGDLNPGATVAFQADWSRKSATLKAKQTIQITASSTIALKSDVVGAKVGSK
jgi:hypothetical protein